MNLTTGKKRIYLAMAVLLLASLACQLPVVRLPFVLQQPTAQPAASTPAATIQPTALPTLPPADTPPVLVETQPSSGSLVPAQGGIVIYFDQPMDRETLTRSIQTEPALQLGLEWLDDATLRVNLPVPLPGGDALRLTFNTNTRSQAGGHLLEPVELVYPFPQPLQVLQQLPADGSVEVNPAAAVVAAFNRPVVALVGEATDQPPGFTLSPPAEGRGEWINTSTFIFYPAPALAGGRVYTATLNPQLSAGQNLDWAFTTARPVATSIEPVQGALVGLDQPVYVYFNQPMHPDSTQTAFRLADEDGRAVTGEFSWNDDSTLLTFTPAEPLARATRYSAVMSAGARSAGGTPLAAPVNTAFLTTADFRLVSTDLVDGTPLATYESGYAQVRLQFTAPPDVVNESDAVRVTPDLAQKMIFTGEGDTELVVAGYFLPNTAYTITLSPEMQDRWGQPLGQVYEVGFETAPAQPALAIPMLQIGASVLFVSPEIVSLPANVTNLPAVSLTSSPIPVEDFIRLATTDRTSYNPRQPRTWRHALTLEPDRSTGVDLPLLQGGAHPAPGLYYFRVTSPRLDASQTPATQPLLIVVSDIQILMKRTATKLFVWAVSARRQEPVGGLPLTVYGEQGQTLGEMVTDTQGVARLELPAGLELHEILYAVSGNHGEPGFTLASTTWNYGLSGWNFGLPVDRDDNQPLVYLYTDRPIYQPGQQVNFRAVARLEQNGRYTTLPDDQLNIKVYGQSDTGDAPLIDEQSLPLNAFGAAHGSLTLPEDAVPGNYAIRIDEAPGTWIGFQVASYQKPEIELQVNLLEENQQIGQPVRAVVRAGYYFGAPADSLSVSWALYARHESFYLPGYQAGKQNDRWLLPAAMRDDFSLLGRQISAGRGATGADGELVVDLPADLLADLDPEIPYRLTFEATIADEARQPVSARADALLHPAAFYLGVQPDSWTGQAGAEVGFDILAFDWNQQPAGAHGLTAEFRKVTWKRIEPDQPYFYPTYKPEYTPVSSADFATDATGRARLSFTPPDPGTYQLEVRGEGAVTQALLWVGGPGMAPWPDLPDQQIQLTIDANAYQAGDTARIFIPNSFGQQTHALITVERAQVMRHFVVSLDAASYTFDLPLGEEDAPNVYVSVTLISADENGLPAFRQGYLNLPVEPLAQTLQVNLTAQPGQAGPGEEVTLALQATDQDGRPAQAEFSLALVDKALLALSEPNSADILTAFYGSQPLGVATSLSTAASSWLLPSISPGRGGGGGDMAPPALREDFRDTAFWRGNLETDATGTASITVTLPDNLTTWVVDARGVTADTRVGSASGEVITTKPLLIRPVTPRFLVAGDHVELAAVVHNNTAEDLSAVIALQSGGVELDDPATARQTVALPAGQQQRVVWWVTALPEETANLIFSASAGDLQDSARPEVGTLPILRYTAWQTFATAGALAEAASRQEWVALPRSYAPQDGELRVELSPSLAATVISGLEALEAYPYEGFPEAVLSRLLPNIEAYRALKDLGAAAPEMSADLDTKVDDGLLQLGRMQNQDGGWGWSDASLSDPFLSAYILFGLSRAQAADFQIAAEMLDRARQYVASVTPGDEPTEAWQMDHQVFQSLMLAESGVPVNPQLLLANRDRLSSWAKAFLALILTGQNTNPEQAAALLADVNAAVVRTATGARWELPEGYPRGFASADFVTAAVVYTLARLDPASPLLIDGARYLAASRSANGGWASSYETAWALLALTEALKGTGDLQSSFDFAASVNGVPLAAGQAAPANLTPIVGRLPLTSLSPIGANLLEISRQAGSGRLYYRAFLELHRAAETAPAVDRGLSISRSYYIPGQDCRSQDCPAVNTIALGDQPVTLLARVTLTLPHEASHLVVEDYIPAGAQVLDLSLETSRQGQQPDVINIPRYDARDPFAGGWGWWLFRGPRIYPERIRWVAEVLPAGVYQLTYRLVLSQAGEFRVLPARAYEYYFPELEGSSAGSILTIQP